jgi:hypothetical protein
MEHNKSLLDGFKMLKEEFRNLAGSITGIDRRLESVEDEVKEIREKVG